MHARVLWRSFRGKVRGSARSLGVRSVSQAAEPSAPKKVLSFSGSGHLLAYQLGAAETLLRERSFDCFAGSSGGALVAALFSCVGRDGLEAFVEEHVVHCKAFTGIEEVLSEDAHVRATGTLIISVTNGITGANELISEFSSRSQLLNVIKASCHIPGSFHPLDFLLGFKPVFPQHLGVEIEGRPDATFGDGGLTDSLPRPSGCAVCTVSPVAGRNGELHICPQDGFSLGLGSGRVAGQRVRLNVRNAQRMVASLRGGSPDDIRELFQNGQGDAERFLRSSAGALDAAGM